MEFTCEKGTFDVKVKMAKYPANGQTAIHLFDKVTGKPVIAATTVVAGYNIDDDCAIVDNTGEQAGVLEFLEDQGFIADTGETINEKYNIVELLI